jgi:undecaprenyl phosphate N,N'-diacetylbacillosamine 1-phosphate transferase
MYRFYIKRIIDFSVSFVLLCLMLPIFFCIAFVIKIDSKGPVFFHQIRLGVNGNRFKIYKFRTMIDRPRLVNSEILKGNSDVTRFGSFLRRFKIDETAQLINIFKGDMSFVGPRPSMPELMNDFNEDAYFRVKVKPGLTGLSQINGNIYLSWEQRWEYDRFYVCNLSFSLDLIILLKTILVVIFGEDKYLKIKGNENSGNWGC